MESLILKPKRVIVFDTGVIVISEEGIFLFTYLNLNIPEQSNVLKYIALDIDSWKDFLEQMLSNNDVPVLDLRNKNE